MENKVLAKVDNYEITMEDYAFFLEALNPQMRQYLSSKDNFKQVVDELIYQQLLFIEAKEKGLDKEEDFIKALEKTESSLLKTYAIGKLLKDAVPTEEEVLNFYNEHSEEFDSKKQVEASHILVEDKEKADEIYEKIKSGEDFSKLAKNFSNCPSKENGGNLGKFGQGQMVKEFDEVVFKMEKGEISKPVKTQFGYHIIKLEEVYPEKRNSLEDVKDQVYGQAKRFKEQEVYSKKIKELSQKHNIEVVNLEPEK